jgi:CHAT domain-containing protein/tetratricopeptide (TPR) repeat protein
MFIYLRLGQVLIYLVAFSSLLFGQTANLQLEPGKPIDRELRGGETHSYTVEVQKDQYLSITTQQKGIDVVVRLIDPAGRRVLEIDSPNGKNGPEPIWYVTETGGRFAVDVSSLEKDAKQGNYEITLNQITPADQDLRNFATASNLVIDGVSVASSDESKGGDRAAAMFDEAARLYTGIQNNDDAKTGGFLRVARAYRALGKRTLALQYFDSAIAICARAAKVPETIRALIDSQSVVTDSLDALSRDQRINELAKTSGDKNTEVGSLMNIAQDYYALGDFQKGLEQNQEALRLANENAMEGRLAGILDNMGNYYTALKDFPRAIEAHTQALEMDRARGQVRPDTILNIGNVYHGLGNYPLAISSFESAYVEFDKRKASVGMAFALSNIGSSYLESGDYDKALEYFLRAQPLKARFLPDDPTSFYNIASVYRLKGQLPKALEFIDKAVDLSIKTGDNSLLADAYVERSDAYRDLGDYRRALDNSSKALELAKKFGYRNVLWSSRLSASNAYVGLKERAMAKQMLEESIPGIVDARRNFFGSDEVLGDFLKKSDAGLKALISMEVDDHRNERAFGLAEKIKALSLVDALAAGKTNIVKMMTPDEFRAESRFKYELASLNGQLAESKNTTEIELIGSRLAMKRLEYEDFRSRLYGAHPELRLRRGEVPELAVKELGSIGIKQNTALAEFVFDENGIVVFIFNGRTGESKLASYKIDLKSTKLDTTIEKFRSTVSNGGLDFQKESRELYDLLVKPLEDELAGKTNIIIVPDGPLWNLPFQALMDEKGKYLVEKAAISYAPSLTALREMSKKAETRKAGPDAELIAFGNPMVDLQTKERVQRVFMSEKLDPLPEAERLVKELGRMYGPTRSKVFTGVAAREEVAKSEVPKYRIVQFATHGILNNVSPMYSHLVLSQDAKNPNEDGLLEAWELKDLDLKADMVILSACDTARGKVSGGEGIIGMTWASFIAGSPTTVASQWKVESSSTTEFMLEFHRQLLAKKRVSKAEAMRRAALKLMKDPKYRHPSYWGAWVLVGDGS